MKKSYSFKTAFITLCSGLVMCVSSIALCFYIREAETLLLIGVNVAFFGLCICFTAIIMFIHRVVYRKIRPLSYKPTTKVIDVSETMSPEKRKVMFRSWEKEWIIQETERLKAIQSGHIKNKLQS